MKNIKAIVDRVLYKEHEVSVHGRKINIKSHRFRKSAQTPQEFADAHMIACGCCEGVIFPGAKIWLYVPGPEHQSDFNKPGVVVIGEGPKHCLVACLALGCVPTAAMMCGELLPDRKVTLFESPMQKAIRTNDVVIVHDMQKYHG